MLEPAWRLLYWLASFLRCALCRLAHGGWHQLVMAQAPSGEPKAVAVIYRPWRAYVAYPSDYEEITSGRFEKIYCRLSVDVCPIPCRPWRGVIEISCSGAVGP